MKKIIVLFIPFVLMLFLFVSTIHADKKDISVTIFSETYAGTFSGATQNGIPSGKGSFVCEDPSASFSLTGTWKEGLLKGDAFITFEDNTVMEVSYSDGLINGEVLEKKKDGSYRTYSSINGHPYGRISCFDSNDKLTNYDFFYQMRPITDLKSDSTDADYNYLISTSYTMAPYRISGSVLAVYDSVDYAYILLGDAKNRLYILNYKNDVYDKYNQAIVPNLIAGDKIVAYGFLQKHTSLSTIKKLGLSTLISCADDNAADSAWYEKIKDYELPFIRLFAGELQDQKSPDKSSLSYNYERIVRYPYLYYNSIASLSGTVTETQINYDKNRLYFCLDVNNESSVLLVQYDYNEGDILPGIGDTVSVDGVYSGNHKIKADTGSDSNTETEQDEDYADIYSKHYTVYPMVSANKVSIR